MQIAFVVRTGLGKFSITIPSLDSSVSVAEWRSESLCVSFSSDHDAVKRAAQRQRILPRAKRLFSNAD